MEKEPNSKNEEDCESLKQYYRNLTDVELQQHWINNERIARIIEAEMKSRGDD